MATHDLSFYKDGSLISDTVFRANRHELALITHDQGTEPTWLVSSIISSGLTGRATSINRDSAPIVPDRSTVVVISFSRTENLIRSALQRSGLEASSSSHFQVQDYFSDLFTDKVTRPGDSEKSISSVFEGILAKLRAASEPKKVLILEHPEILLAATDLSPNALLTWVKKLRQECNLLFGVFNTHWYESNPSLPAGDPVFRISDFFAKCHYMSSLNVHILPLPTGRAVDVTGCITVSGGAVPDKEVLPGDYTFFVVKENLIKIFVR